MFDHHKEEKNHVRRKNSKPKGKVAVCKKRSVQTDEMGRRIGNVNNMKEILEKYLESEIVIRMNAHDADKSYTLTGVGDDYFTAEKNSAVFGEETLHVPYTSIFKAVETDSHLMIELNDTSTIESFTINAYGELIAISKKLAEVEKELDSLKRNSDSIKSTVENIRSGIRFI